MRQLRRVFWRGMSAGLAGTAMGTGLYPVVPSASLNWVSRRRGKGKSFRAGSVAKEWGASVLNTATRPLGFAGARLATGRGPRPVVVVHGYVMNRSSFLLLARRMVRAGSGSVYGFEYWTMGKVSSASRRLDEFIEELCAREGCEQVDIVGHSMGGLVGRYYLTLGPGKNKGRVAHLITLGTPHGGTAFSHLGIGRAQKELKPDTAFFERLKHAGVPEQTKVCVIWSRADALVWSPSQARWHGVQDELVYDRLGHVSLLYSRSVASAVCRRLA